MSQGEPAPEFEAAVEKKLAVLDSHALEERETDLVALPVGDEVEAPVWLTVAAHRAHPGFWFGLAGVQAGLLYGCFWLPQALAAWVSILVMSLSLLVPEACEAALQGREALRREGLARRWVSRCAMTMVQMITAYFRLYLLGIGLVAASALGIFLVAMVVAPLLGAGSAEVIGVAGGLMAALALAAVSLTEVVLPTILSVPAHAFGVRSAVAFRRCRALARANAPSLIAFSVPVGAAALGGLVGVSALMGVSLPLGLFALFLGGNALLGLWSHRFLQELQAMAGRSQLPARSDDGPPDGR